MLEVRGLDPGQAVVRRLDRHRLGLDRHRLGLESGLDRALPLLVAHHRSIGLPQQPVLAPAVEGLFQRLLVLTSPKPPAAVAAAPPPPLPPEPEPTVVSMPRRFAASQMSLSDRSLLAPSIARLRSASMSSYTMWEHPNEHHHCFQFKFILDDSWASVRTEYERSISRKPLQTPTRFTSQL